MRRRVPRNGWVSSYSADCRKMCHTLIITAHVRGIAEQKENARTRTDTRATSILLCGIWAHVCVCVKEGVFLDPPRFNWSNQARFVPLVKKGEKGHILCVCVCVSTCVWFLHVTADREGETETVWLEMLLLLQPLSCLSLCLLKLSSYPLTQCPDTRTHTHTAFLVSLLMSSN